MALFRPETHNCSLGLVMWWVKLAGTRKNFRITKGHINEVTSWCKHYLHGQRQGVWIIESWNSQNSDDWGCIPPTCMWDTPILHVCSLETPSFYNLRTKHDMKTKLASINFSRQGTEDSRSSWLQTLGIQLIGHLPYNRYRLQKLHAALFSFNKVKVNLHMCGNKDRLSHLAIGT